MTAHVPPSPPPRFQGQRNVVSFDIPEVPYNAEDNSDNLYISDEDLIVTGLPSDDDSVDLESGR